MRAFDVPRSVLSVDLVSKVIGWRPRMDFNEGIRRTLADLAAKASFASME
jgi:nucleoside-diphosphate-sugar epimerase